MLGKNTSGDPESFMRDCVEKFEDEYENMLYFGVAKQRIDHPPKPNKGKNKLLHFIS